MNSQSGQSEEMSIRNAEHNILTEEVSMITEMEIASDECVLAPAKTEDSAMKTFAVIRAEINKLDASSISDVRSALNALTIKPTLIARKNSKWLAYFEFDTPRVLSDSAELTLMKALLNQFETVVAAEIFEHGWQLTKATFLSNTPKLSAGEIVENYSDRRCTPDAFRQLFKHRHDSLSPFSE